MAASHEKKETTDIEFAAAQSTAPPREVEGTNLSTVEVMQEAPRELLHTDLSVAQGEEVISSEGFLVSEQPGPDPSSETPLQLLRPSFGMESESAPQPTQPEPAPAEPAPAEPEPEPAPASATQGNFSFCPECGTKNNSGAQFCGSCGHNLK